VHGIVTKGGDAPNIIPAHTSGKYMVRAQALEDLDAVRSKVYRCFEAGALATGSTLEIVGGDKPYAEMHHDAEIAAIYKHNSESLGRMFPDLGATLERAAASTDMGNVSFVLPSIHPMIGIDCLPAVNHQPEFTAHCITEAADKALMDGALSMAWTAIEVATSVGLRQRLISGG
jgi:metal-dependent amidase/aminoacylase/carboxypeptidase family protein